MKTTCLLAVAVVWWSLTSAREVEDVMAPGYSCLSWTPADRQTRVTFVHVDGAGVRSLYSSLWAEDLKLVTCEVVSDLLVTEGNPNHCNRNETHGQELLQKFNLSSLVAPDGPCVRASNGAPEFAERTGGDARGSKTRRKRAMILPGTLWCGSGSKAIGYDQLGMFESADRCCREHDHCLHIIPALTVNYGVFNPNFFTVSLCECDQRFRQCLMSVNDSISSMVGYSFFNILRVPCFELQQLRRCTEMYWFGMCKKASVAPYAIFKNPLPYNTSDVTNEYDVEGQPASIDPTISPHRKSSKSEHRCGFRDPPRGDTFHRRRTKGRGCRQQPVLPEVEPSGMPPTSRTLTATPTMKAGLSNVFKSSSITSKEKEAGKSKSVRKGLSGYSKQKRLMTKSPQTSSTTPTRTPQRPELHLDPTTDRSGGKITGRRKKIPEKNQCCGSGKLVRGDSFQPNCKNCLEQDTSSHKTDSPKAKTTSTKLSPLELFHLQKKTEASKRETLETISEAITSVPPSATKLKTPRDINKQQKQEDSRLKWSNTNQKPIRRTIPQTTHAEKNLQQKNALHNKTDHEQQCGSLRLLDECKFKIPPLEKKYDLQNSESQTSYHCDCISRLAIEIESFEQPSILPLLLEDFVSQQCFTLPKEKKCHSRKRCSGGFTKASDLHRALKKIEEKDTARVQISSNARKRGIPVRLYKRCLRLKRKADFMAQHR